MRTRWEYIVGKNEKADRLHGRNIRICQERRSSHDGYNEGDRGFDAGIPTTADKAASRCDARKNTIVYAQHSTRLS